MDNSKRIFGGRLKQERKKRGLRQEDLSTELNMAASTIKNWEQGRTWPEMPDFIRLCNFFDCDLDYLVGRLDEKTHDLAYICSKTGLSERTATAFIKEPEIVEALNSLDTDELLVFSRALNNAIDSIEGSVDMLLKDDPDERSRINSQRHKTELAAFRFREACGELINKWCDLDTVFSQMKKKEEAYLRELAEEEARREKEREEAARRPPRSAEETEELYQKWRQMIDRTEANNG